MKPEIQDSLYDPSQAIKLVLTGGPSGGKTTLAQAIQREYGDQVVIVPEAASILWSGGWPRRTNREGVRHQQRAIYYIQREMEQLIATENAHRLLICDRGSLDGLAYWPDRDDPFAYLKSLNTKLEDEVDRYDWVLHLDTPRASGYDTSNPLRNESHEEALKLNDRIREAWNHHPRRFVVGNTPSGKFVDKLTCALYVIENILKGEAFDVINEGMIRLRDAH
jgi:hypothetical protein